MSIYEYNKLQTEIMKDYMATHNGDIRGYIRNYAAKFRDIYAANRDYITTHSNEEIIGTIEEKLWEKEGLSDLEKAIIF